MVDVLPDQARTLAAIATLGSFDAAARHLALTPSAVSQRIAALERAVGRPVLHRARPVRLTGAGEAVARFARQVDLLAHDLADELGREQEHPRLTLVVNGDSLHTWALPALASVAGRVQLEVLREDQEHSLDLVRSGAAAAAVTSVADPLPGCRSTRLGTMRYRPCAAPGFADKWFADGSTRKNLSRAPLLVFDRKDDLQDRYLRRRLRCTPDVPRHHVPAAEELAEAIRLGMGWGMVADLERARRPDGLLVLDPSYVDVVLHWQQWRSGPAALTAVAEAVLAAAREALI